MLDLFDDEIKDKKIVDPLKFLKEACSGSKITVFEYGSYYLPTGWTVIIQDFIKKTQNHSIEITKCEEKYGQVELNFTPQKKAMEVKVWRALDELRKKSVQTCMYCGATGKRKIYHDQLVVICKDCIHANEKKGITGTWLDKY